MGVAVLTPDERAVVAGTGDGRRREFATGRWCARDALSQTGYASSEFSLLPDADGVPSWPHGWVGSITHTPGWVGAVACRRGGRGGVASLGLDAERPGAVGTDVLGVVADDREQEDVRRLSAARPEVEWATVLHVAKEAAYKAWFPVGRAVLHHGEVAVDLRDSTRFRARVGPAGERAQRIDGRWTSGPTAVVALATLSQADAGSR